MSLVLTLFPRLPPILLTEFRVKIAMHLISSTQNPVVTELSLNRQLTISAYLPSKPENYMDGTTSPKNFLLHG